MNYFGPKVRELREKRKLLLREVAAHIHADTAVVSKIERGERNATRPQVLALAQILETDTEELLALWMADKFESLILQEPEAAYSALKMVHKHHRK
ncbi:MAG: helix-turn-helix domain-containing protein [Bacteroidota bacterium]|jgi:transcriptional regulator with XRE-family HTH domain